MKIIEKKNVHWIRLFQIISSFAENKPNKYIEDMWVNARNRLHRTPYRVRSLQAYIAYYDEAESNMDIHEYAAEIW